MSAVRALFAGPGARRALVDRARGEVEVVSRGGGAYVSLAPADWILLAEPGAPFGPLSLAVDGLDGLELVPGTPAEVTPGRLSVGGRAVSLERMRIRSCAVGGPPAVAAAAAEAPLPDPPASLQPGLAALREARVPDAVRLLAGLGEGLTPTGDDVLAGYAAARFALGAPVALSKLASGRSSALGLAYLRCAEHGELPDVGSLRLWGATSGTAIAWGINCAVASLTDTVNRERSC
jgi:Protein of unknown function (DUF2877)